MKTIFNLELNLEGASQEDKSNIIGCILNEDVQEVNALGMKIQFKNLRDVPENFHVNSTRKLVCYDAEGDIIIDMLMTGEVARAFKDNVRASLNL